MLLTQVSSQLQIFSYVTTTKRSKGYQHNYAANLFARQDTWRTKENVIYDSYIHIHKTKSFALINYFSVFEGHTSHTIAFHYVICTQMLPKPSLSRFSFVHLFVCMQFFLFYFFPPVTSGIKVHLDNASSNPDVPGRYLQALWDSGEIIKYV